MLKVEFDRNNGICKTTIGGNDNEVLRETLMAIRDIYILLEREGCGQKFKKLLRHNIKKRNAPVWSCNLLEGDQITSYNMDGIMATLGGDQ